MIEFLSLSVLWISGFSAGVLVASFPFMVWARAGQLRRQDEESGWTDTQTLDRKASSKA